MKQDEDHTTREVIGALLITLGISIILIAVLITAIVFLNEIAGQP